MNEPEYSRQVIDHFRSGEADDEDWEKLRQFIIKGQMIDLIEALHDANKERQEEQDPNEIFPRLVKDSGRTTSE